jgi:hypothetical protein
MFYSGPERTLNQIAATRAEGSIRFWPPWRVDKIPGGHIARDAHEQALAYVYSRADPTLAMQGKAPMADEARRIGMNIARCPICSGRPSATDDEKLIGPRPRFEPYEAGVTRMAPRRAVTAAFICL